MKQKCTKICLVSFFTHEAFFIPLSNMREILGAICSESHSVFVVTPDLMGTLPFDLSRDTIILHKKENRLIFRIINYVILNLKISRHVLQKSSHTDSFIFFMQTGLPLPMMIAKFRNKKIIWLLPSSYRKMNEKYQDFLNQILFPWESLSYRIADKIIVYSPNLIREWKLQDYAGKILIAHEHFINSDIFAAKIPLCRRPLLIGYIGRLSEEKGVRNFVSALPGILNNRKDITVFIGGDGPLKDEIGIFLQREKLTSRVSLAGWIAHGDLPEYLNKLRLLILPSYTEGLPNIILEAFSCGTPVLATSVGTIPDIIKDKKTGFILEHNCPEGISDSILSALEDPNLEKIAMNAKQVIEQEFTLDSTIKQWKKIFDEQNS